MPESKLGVEVEASNCFIAAEKGSNFEVAGLPEFDSKGFEVAIAEGVRPNGLFRGLITEESRNGFVGSSLVVLGTFNEGLGRPAEVGFEGMVAVSKGFLGPDVAGMGVGFVTGPMEFPAVDKPGVREF